MTPADRPIFLAGNRAELLALLPYLLGYHPTDSLVDDLVAVRGFADVEARPHRLPGQPHPLARTIEVTRL